MICILDAQGYCSRHDRKHYGHTKRIALDPSEQAEAIRLMWDEEKSSPTGDNKKCLRSLPMAKQCIYLGAEHPPAKVGCGSCSKWDCQIHGQVNLSYCVSKCNEWDNGNIITIEKEPDKVIPFLDANPDITDNPPSHLAGWWGWPNVQQAFRQALQAWKAEEGTPQAHNGRQAVLLIGGGERYESGLYVACRMLRAAGWTGAIEVWHRGHIEPVHVELFEPMGVVVVDALKFRDANPGRARRWGGQAWADPHNRWGAWGMKSYAVLNSKYRTIFYTDADWYLTGGLDELRNVFRLAEEHGSCIWYDTNDGGNDDNVKWKLHGLVSDGKKGTQGGQWAVDKANLGAMKALQLYRKLDDYSDYYYHHHFGDQDSMRLAWSVAEAPRFTFPGRCSIRAGGMLAPGLRGYLGVHRIHDKQFKTLHPHLPKEDEAMQYASDYSKAVGVQGG